MMVSVQKHSSHALWWRSHESYIFLFQVEEVVDGFVHQLRATGDCHQVRVCSSTLGKPEINLGTEEQRLREGLLRQPQFLRTSSVIFSEIIPEVVTGMI